MKRQVCNNCGQPLRLLDKGHIHNGKVVCPRCIKTLNPKAVKPKINYAKVAVEAIDRATYQSDDDRKRAEDARYERAKRRVVFFVSGCIWLIQLVLVLVVIAMIPLVIISIGILGWLFP